jgi:hypothetical protein
LQFESDVAGVLDMKDAEGLTAQQLAEQFEHSNMARLLQVQVRKYFAYHFQKPFAYLNVI